MSNTSKLYPLRGSHVREKHVRSFYSWSSATRDIYYLPFTTCYMNASKHFLFVSHDALYRNVHPEAKFFRTQTRAISKKYDTRVPLRTCTILAHVELFSVNVQSTYIFFLFFFIWSESQLRINKGQVSRPFAEEVSRDWKVDKRYLCKFTYYLTRYGLSLSYLFLFRPIITRIY